MHGSVVGLVRFNKPRHIILTWSEILDVRELRHVLLILVEFFLSSFRVSLSLSVCLGVSLSMYVLCQLSSFLLRICAGGIRHRYVCLTITVSSMVEWQPAISLSSRAPLTAISIRQFRIICFRWTLAHRSCQADRTGMREANVSNTWSPPNCCRTVRPLDGAFSVLESRYV